MGAGGMNRVQVAGSFGSFFGLTSAQEFCSDVYFFPFPPMKPKHLLTSLATALVLTSGASAAVLASWTFENSALTTSGPFAAEVGTGSASGFHVGSSTYSSVAGNGSTKAFSSNTWAVGDYYEFTTSSTGYEGITITFDQTGSNTGPKDFKLQYSINGTSFTDVPSGGYAVINNSWSAAAPKTGSSYSFDLSSITVLNNSAAVFFRVTDTSAASINNATVAAGGTSRIDNFTISAVPEPASALLGSLGFLAMLRRRR